MFSSNNMPIYQSSHEPITLYKSNNENAVELAIKFSTPAVATEFMQSLKKESKNKKSYNELIRRYSGSENIIYFTAYVSSENRLTVNFESMNQRLAFCAELGLNNHQIQTDSRYNVIFQAAEFVTTPGFNLKLKKKNIQSHQSKYAKSATSHLPSAIAQPISIPINSSHDIIIFYKSNNPNAVELAVKFKDHQKAQLFRKSFDDLVGNKQSSKQFMEVFPDAENIIYFKAYISDTNRLTISFNNSREITAFYSLLGLNKNQIQTDSNYNVTFKAAEFITTPGFNISLENLMIAPEYNQSNRQISMFGSSLDNAFSKKLTL